MSEDDQMFPGLSEPDTIPFTCLGLPIDGTLAKGAYPVDVFMVVRSIHEGEFTYDMMTTLQLDTITCMGMLRWAQVILDHGVLNHSESAEDE